MIAGARMIAAGEADLVVAGGVESMTRAPFVIGKADAPSRRNAEIYDTTIGWRFVNPAMRKAYGVDSMPETAENVATDSRSAAPTRTPSPCGASTGPAAAQANGCFDGEIAPVTIPDRKGDIVVEPRRASPRRHHRSRRWPR